MRQYTKRVLCLLFSLAMLVSLCACGDKGGDTQTDGTLENGNVITAPAEEGSEEELTAVREELIKYAETEGFGDIDKMEFYENGVRTTSSEYVQVKDNKKFYYSGDTKRLVNYADGYILDMPASWAPDFTLSTAISKFTGDGVTMIASNETYMMSIVGVDEAALQDNPTFARGEAYIQEMFRFITTDEYLKENDVEKLSEETMDLEDDQRMYVLRMVLGGCEEGVQNYYTYVVCYSELTLHHFMFKCVDDRDFSDIYSTYKSIYEKGAGVDTLAYPCEDNPSWSAQTKEYYDSLMNTETVQWGLYHGNLEQDPLKVNYRVMEMEFDYKFPLVSSYSDKMSADFPVAQAKKVSADGRHIQFNYHFEYNWGNTMGADAPVLDVYRGQLDEEFRRFAKQVVEYGEPMLFRLNNEMNSDWTTWSAMNAMLDPEIFTETWIRMYNIFEEEGANAYCIWVWNPQSDYSFPNARWNDLRLYMPGAKYVDMIGLTSYNFGDGEQWASFETLYTALNDYYSQYFGDWGWIISEFGCSDTDKDKTRKAQWITDMFTCFEEGMYPNIKAAVWFNANDYVNGQLTNEIVLDDSDLTMEAFKEGLHRTQ